MNRIKTFLLVPTPMARSSLRRFSSGEGCSSRFRYHNAMAYIGDTIDTHSISDNWPHDDPRWPTKCEACDYQFKEKDVWQNFKETIWERVDTSEKFTLSDAPVGAMWFANWLEEFKHWCGPDGRSLHVRTPGGDWCVDGRASNCTLPDDKQHKCWTRTGEAPNVTVGKEYGPTCGAGAGSIIVGNYHGFLRGGWLEEI